MWICARSARRRRVGGWLAFAGLWVLSAACAGMAVAQDIVQVEEEWELVVKDPDPDLTAPQVTCAISPTGDVDGLHATFELNHQSFPFFASGGMRLQVWSGEENVSSHKTQNDGVMTTAGETVRWTQSLRLHGGSLIFEIKDGTSTTWGEFGGEHGLRSTRISDLTSLNGYDPDVSVANSGTGYASNRVASLTLKRVRVTFDNGDVVVDDTARVVEQPTDNSAK